ncbi:hypothetical protein [Inmirania thermothiophila]|uniref:YfdX protein n=1 Tax=Inmirania thermothiophila TaxID=1750597 RepID=A0A3N1Y5N6_9GAMM|nr:hypothetical protein [Inmirania thermothiophila]ROR34113.1 hypothetical protein EDC57_0008 [Inmirania thermothiophila]
MPAARALARGLGCALLALAVAAGPVAPAGADEGLAQRLRLLRYYLQPDLTRPLEQAANPRARELLARARDAAEAAERAAEAGDEEEAARRTETALQLLASARSAAQERADGDTPRDRERIRQMRQEIEAYRQAFDAGLREKGPQAAALLDRARFEALVAEAREAERKGRLGEARTRLEHAYQMIVTALTRLRRNDTVVYGLDFRTPADEYAYEQRRNESYRMLVEQMAAEAEAARRRLADPFRDRAEQLRQEAEAAAAAGDWARAIRTMEEANRQLVRALRAMGLPVPG